MITVVNKDRATTFLSLLRQVFPESLTSLCSDTSILEIDTKCLGISSLSRIPLDLSKV